MIRKIVAGILVVLAIAAVAFYFSFKKFVDIPRKTLSTSVHVIEGIVVVTHINADGSQGKVQTLRSGETAMVNTQVVDDDSFVFEKLKPVFLKATQILFQELEVLAKSAPPVFDVKVTESDFNSRVGIRVERSVPGVERVRFALSSKGIVIYGNYQNKWLKFDWSIDCVLHANEHGKIYIDLREGRAKGIKLPKFFLESLEEIFWKTSQETQLKLRINRIVHLHGSVEISGVKPT